MTDQLLRFSSISDKLCGFIRSPMELMHFDFSCFGWFWENCSIPLTDFGPSCLYVLVFCNFLVLGCQIIPNAARVLSGQQQPTFISCSEPCRVMCEPWGLCMSMGLLPMCCLPNTWTSHDPKREPCCCAFLPVHGFVFSEPWVFSMSAAPSRFG